MEAAKRRNVLWILKISQDTSEEFQVSTWSPSETVDTFVEGAVMSNPSENKKTLNMLGNEIDDRIARLYSEEEIVSALSYLVGAQLSMATVSDMLHSVDKFPGRNYDTIADFATKADKLNSLMQSFNVEINNFMKERFNR
jgi:hypothetical protein